MYRNISYRIDANWDGVIRLDTWDENGNPITEEHTHKSHLFYDYPKGDDLSVYGHKLRRLEFNSIIGRNKWIKEHRGHNLIFESIPPVREFLLDRFGGQQEDADFMKYKLRVHFFDIEIAVEDEFPEPKKAEYPINVMTIYDTKLCKYFTWICTEDTELPFECDEDVEYFIFSSETKMLQNFLAWFQNNYPDVISGWNIDGFDIPYLVNRLKKKLGYGEELKLSPIRKILIKEGVIRRGEFRPIDEYRIEGITCLDYLFLYRTKFSTKNLSSHKLENVGQEELGYGKLEYNGSIKDFWKRNFVDFVKYNIQDVKLLFDLDTKLNYIALARKMCNMGLCEYSSIYKSQPYIYGAIVLEALKDGKRVLSIGLDEQQKTSKFIGAHVFEPRTGFYGRGVSSLDLNSLYPSIMIMLNISPETKVGRVLEETDEYVLIKTADNGDIVKYTQAKYQALLKNHLCISHNKILYWKSTKKKGFIPKFLERLYSERRAKKDKMLEIKAIIEEKKKEGVLDTKLNSLRDLLDTTQHAYKIFLNSIYGQFGSQYFPMYDIENAEAVTVSGQYIIKSSSEYINWWFKEYYDQDDSLVYGDTDSCFYDNVIKIQKIKKIEIEIEYEESEPCIGDLYNEYNNESYEKQLTLHGHEMINVDNLNVLSFSDKEINRGEVDYLPVKRLIRHKVSKGKYEICCIDGKSTIVTEDHGCVVIRNGELFRIKPNDILLDDLLMVTNNKQMELLLVKEVNKLEDFKDEFVYDIEMESHSHVFFSDNILIHNSNYFQIEGFVNSIIGDEEFTQDNINQLCEILDKDFVPAVNRHCWKITQEYFHSPSKRIEFKRETFCTEGMFLAKKRYILHVRNEEGVYVDKFKYTGVEVKKSEHPQVVKGFLKHIIEKSMTERWDGVKYKKEISLVWDEYRQLDFSNIGYYKGFNSAKNPQGFLRHAKGATVHSKGVMYHNQLLENIGIRGKYEDIQLGEKVRFLYIEKNNEYRIPVIAWKDGSLPTEFSTMFHINYPIMFEKSVLKPLERIIAINKWPEFDPTVEELRDINDLFD